jgi:rubrerythrin
MTSRSDVVERPNPDAIGVYELSNRTGIAASPEEAAAQAQGALEGPVTPGEPGILLTRSEYEAAARPVGTMPPPVEASEAAEDEAEIPQLLLDKLSERCGFERSGVRLYEGLIGKLRVRGSFQGGPTEEQLQHILDEELAHFQLVSTVITRLGGDPTAMSPCANVSAVASMGLVQVMSDPRTTLAQGLHAVLVAELVDNDGWRMLIDICRNAGQEDLVASFEKAAESEDEHLDSVRAWLDAHAELVADDPEADAHGDGNVSPLS